MINKPRGTNDIFGKKIKIYQSLNEQFRHLLATYNYQELETPLFEQREVFVRGVGNSSDIVSKEMYEFQDRKNRTFVLRPEGTSGIVRALIENKMYVQNNLPVKVFYTGPMFRYERPQLGRSRQFNQFGIESFGTNSAAQDFEILTIAMKFMTAIGLDEQTTIYMNYLITGIERKNYLQELKAYLNTIPDLCADCQTRINSNPLRVLDCKVDQDKLVAVPDMQAYLTSEEKAYFQQVS
jgi:histidyl-tRNA synthetase